MSKVSTKLTYFIIFSFFLGGCLGLLLQKYTFPYSDTLLKLCDIGGKGFIQILKYIATPLVFISIIGSIANLGSFKALGKIGFKTLSLYLLTTIIAIVSSLIIMNLINPKFHLKLDQFPQETQQQSLTLSEIVYHIFTKNPFSEEGNMLQIILLAFMLGSLLMVIFGENKRVRDGLKKAHDWMISLVVFFMYFAPIGVFCLLVQIFYSVGFDVIIPLGSYLSLIFLMIFFQGFIVYPLFLKFMGDIDPIDFYKKIKNVILVACSTASSNATLPVTLETVEKELLVDPVISSFSIPLGATVNMDALAAAYGVATVFLANAYGIELTFMQYFIISFWTVMASIGTAGIPGVGLIALSMVFQQVNLPIHGIPILMSVSRLGDTLGTALNVTGDIVVTCIVAKSEGKMGNAHQ